METSEIDPSLNKLFPIIFNNAFDAIVVYKCIRGENNEVIDFVFKYMNDSSFKILKGNRGDYIGKSFLTLFPYSTEDGMYNSFKTVAETGIASENVFYYEYGEYKGWYRNSVIQNDGDLIVYFKDVTAHKELAIKMNKTVKEKELLLKETHHRIKNNLQIVASIINLQCSYVNDPEFVSFFVESQNRIKAIALIHQKLYEGKTLSSINFESYIEDLVGTLFRTYRADEDNITLIYDIENIEIGTDLAINLGLIINELITNALKYAFPENKLGEIKISIKSLNDIITVIVEDNGIEFPAHIDFRNTKTLGMQLIISLTEQNNGEIELDNIQGTKFTLTFDKTLQKKL